MKTKKKDFTFNKMLEGLGILIMLIGTSQVKDYSDETNKYVIWAILMIGGWLLYSFSNKIK